MYYPKSQIKTNLYTNGGEYIVSTTQDDYKGFYYELSSGQKYTGKSPEDAPNILLLSLNAPPPQINELPLNPPQEITLLSGENSYPIIPPTRSLPQFNLTLPTQQDKSLGIFTRYFCKKNNELIYIEISKETHDLLKDKAPQISWDLYTPINMLWDIKGNKEQVIKANQSTVSLIEQRQKWYGFSKYLKEDYLKYFVGE